MAERSTQVDLMGQIYGRASGVIVWLRPENPDSAVCKRYLHSVEQIIHETADIFTPGRPGYSIGARYGVFQIAFLTGVADAEFAPAIRRFWSR